MKKAMLLFVSLLLSAGANAATFDFASYADTEGEGGFATYTKTESGITVEATAQAGGNDIFAYLDESNANGPAGLGACGSLFGPGAGILEGYCDPSNDDNVDNREQLTLAFDKSVTLTEIDFQDGNHVNNFTGSVQITAYEAGMLISSAVYALVDVLNVPFFGDTFEFLNVSKGTEKGDKFYIKSLNAEVPVPAAVFLFAPALLGFLGLRRKAAQAV